MHNEKPAWIFENFGIFSNFISNHGWGLTFGTFIVMYFIAMFSIESDKYNYQRKNDDFMEDIFAYGQLALVFTIVIMVLLPILLTLIDFIIPLLALSIVIGIILGVLYGLRKLVQRKYAKRDSNDKDAKDD